MVTYDHVSGSAPRSPLPSIEKLAWRTAIAFPFALIALVLGVSALFVALFPGDSEPASVAKMLIGAGGSVRASEAGILIKSATVRANCTTPAFFSGDASPNVNASSRTALFSRGVPFLRGDVRDDGTPVDVVIGGYGSAEAASVEVFHSVRVRASGGLVVDSTNDTLSGAIDFVSGGTDGLRAVTLAAPIDLVSSHTYVLPSVGGEVGDQLLLGLNGHLQWGPPPVDSLHGAIAPLVTFPSLPVPGTWDLVDPLPPDIEHRVPGNGLMTATFAIRAGVGMFYDGVAVSPGGAVEKWQDVRDVSGTADSSHRIQQGGEINRPTRSTQRRNLAFNGNDFVSFSAQSSGIPIFMRHANDSFVPFDPLTGSHCSYFVATQGDPADDGVSETAVWGAGYGPSGTGGAVGNVVYAGMASSDSETAEWEDVVYGTKFSGGDIGGLDGPITTWALRTGWDFSTMVRISISCFARTGETESVLANTEVDSRMNLFERSMPLLNMSETPGQPMFAVGGPGAYPNNKGFYGNLAEMGIFSVDAGYEGLMVALDVLSTHLFLRYGLNRGSFHEYKMSDGRRPLAVYEESTDYPVHVFGIARDDAGGLLVERSMSQETGAPRVMIAVAGVDRVLKHGVSWALLAYKEARFVMKGWQTPKFIVHASEPTIVNVSLPVVTEPGSQAAASDADRLGLDVAIVGGGGLAEPVIYALNTSVDSKWVCVNVSEGTTIAFGSSVMRDAGARNTWTTVVADDAETGVTYGYAIAPDCGRPLRFWSQRPQPSAFATPGWALHANPGIAIGSSAGVLPTSMPVLRQFESDHRVFVTPSENFETGHPRNHVLVECEPPVA